ncbi:hypothetical protein V2J09_009280 [Rumex salicifolius]
MHGRPRVASKPEDEAALAAKAVKLRALQSQFLHNHHNKIYEKEALEASAKLLEINPECYTAWNYRKLAVDYLLSQSDSDSDSIQAVLNEELRIVESALRQNYKSYGAWHHRKWVLSKGQSSVDRELRLLDQFQKADSRNFHAWSYRRFVAALKNIPDEDELKYTTDMIERNFSNYSAWHNRSVILSNLLKKRAEGFFPKEKILNEEYELVLQAIFTDPDDQSGWFYHLWLLEQTVKLDAPVLISSWPAPGSEVALLLTRDSAVQIVSPFSGYCPDSGTIPIVLYFDQPVTGVNSSTVVVQSAFSENSNMVWRPLSTNKCQPSQAWVTELKYSDINIDSFGAFPVEVSLGDSHGIVSSSGVQIAHAFQTIFMVQLELVAEHLKGQEMEMISWQDSKFEKYESEVQGLNLIPSFDQLRINKEQEGVAYKWKFDLLENEITLFRELLSDKIGKLTLARLLTALDTITSFDSTSNLNQMGNCEEVLELYKSLMESDLPHIEYYKDEYSLALLRKVASNKQALLSYCFQYKTTVSDNGHFLCLRLNNQSLTRIGSINRLLWVKMLDLSHNDLRTLEGLEAMKLLSCLNLSHNKLKSFTVLEPLRQLKALKVLDISHNEIGEHSIDTTRYLWCSPLSHTVECEWELQEVSAFGMNTPNYWEAYSVFKDLNLTQLDILGNAVVDVDFKSFLCKFLPTLKWLDGATVS